MKPLNFVFVPKPLLLAVLVCMTTAALGQNFHPLAFGLASPSTATNWYKDYVGLRFEVTAPTAIAGNKIYTAANDGLGTATDWGGVVTTPIVNVPIVMELTTDSFGCTSFPAGSMAGKIAVIWRGPLGTSSCPFAEKACAAQTAGAIACVIINEYPGEGPVGMGFTAGFCTVTIPVFMIGYNDGIAISAQYHALPAGSVTMTITPWSLGLANDLGLVPEGNAAWHAHAVPANQLTGTSPYPYRGLDGAFVANFGHNRATNVKVTGALSFTPSASSTATIVHRDTTDLLASFPTSDSIWAMYAPNLYSLSATGTGRFDLTYNIMSDSVDASPADNTITDTFYASDSVYSKGRYNFSGNVPEISDYISPETGGSFADFMWGPMYYIAHGTASISSVQFTLYNGLDGYFLGVSPINVYALKWIDGSGGEPLDSIVQNGELSLVSRGVYTFSATDSSGVILKAQMGDPVTGVPGLPILLDTNSWYYIAVDVPSGYGLGCDGQLSPYPRVYGRYHNSGTIDYPGIMWLGDYSSGTNLLTAAPGQADAPCPFPNAFYVNSIDSFNYSAQKGMVPAVSLIVNNNPSAYLAGSSGLCAGATTTLGDITSGGTWRSSNTAVATVGTAGVVTGVTAGTATISYTYASGVATKTLTVNPLPLAITGPLSICVGTTATLADATTGGTWQGSGTGVATVGSGAGIVTPVAGGVATVTYTLSTGCAVQVSVTVSTSAPAISGTSGLCGGTVETLSDAITGGTWESTSTVVATIGSGSGTVFGITPGTSVINYTTPAGCAAATTITVNIGPTLITGTPEVCIGSCEALSDGASGGSWTSSNPGVATVNSTTGQVCGILAGTSVITYSLGAGCRASVTVTVGMPSAPIGGILFMCEGTTSRLTETSTGGTWGSSNPAVASVTSGGTVTGGTTAGTATITYSLAAGCPATATVTVSAPPSPVTGILSICIGSSTALSDATSGGAWSSSNPAVATINSITGVAYGLTPGTTMIGYSAGGCSVTSLTDLLTVLPPPPAITGTPGMCVGTTSALSDATTGGTWSSGSTVIATVDAATGIVSGVSLGTTTITYTTGTGCAAFAIVTVDLPPPAITGAMSGCAGTTTALSDAATGGTWGSGSTAIATVGIGTGIVTAVSSGTTVINYTVDFGCAAYASVTVDLSPLAITGTASICTGTSTTLADATTGGIWSSGTTAVAIAGPGTGVITPVSPGTSMITYTLSDGCGANVTATVNPLPSAIAGTMSVCIGAATTLSDAVSGGAWSSGSTAVASVTAGTVTGVSAGTAEITYALAGGCTASADVTVNPLPSPSIVVSGLTLSTAVPYASYQWLLTGLPVGGATAATYTAIINGVYSVTVYDGNGCSATSGVTIITNVGVENISAANEEITVFPNPNDGTFTLLATSAINAQAIITITNIVGEKINEFTAITNTEIPVALDKYNRVPGMYFLSVKTASGVRVEKISVK